MLAPELAQPAAAIEAFRGRVLSTALGLFVPAITVAGAFQLYMYRRTGELLRMGPPLVVAWLVLFALWRARGLSHRARAFGALAVGVLLASSNFLRHGYFGAGRLLLLDIVFFATLVLGVRAAIAVVTYGAALFTLPVVGLVGPPATHLDFSQPSVWMAATAVMLLLPVGVVGPVRLLLRDLDASLAEGRRLLEQARAAQSEAERSLHELEDNRARLQAIVDHSTAAIYVKDHEGRFLLVNRHLLERLGRPDAAGKTDHELFPREAADRFREHDLEVFRSGKVRRWRETSPSPEGEKTYVSVKFPIRDAKGDVYAMGGISTDVTELDAAESLRLDQEAIFDAALAACPDAIGVSGARDGVFSLVNPGFCALMQRTPEEAVGKTALELDIWTNPADRTALMQALMSSGEVHEFPVVVQSKDGTPKECEFSAKVLEGPAGPQVLAVVRDVSERRKAELEISRLGEELEAAVLERTRSLDATNRDLESFSYTVSHDLRAPLRHMAGYIDLVGAKLPADADPETRRLVGVISQSAAKMGQLIDDLLRFARLGRVEMALADVDFDSLVRGTITELEAEHAGRKIEWVVAPHPKVRGDRALLKQVLVNLLGNAVKYTREKPRARIEVGVRSGGAGGPNHEFFVKDNGAGFDMRYADRLFGVFQRLHPDYEGTGVGLAHVKRILDRHGGSVRAEAVKGEGATFTFVLPRAG